MHTLAQIQRDKSLLQPCFYIANIFLLCVARCTENRRYRSRRGSEHKERTGLSHSVLSAGHSVTHSRSPTLTTVLSLLHVHQHSNKFLTLCGKVSTEKFDTWMWEDGSSPSGIDLLKCKWMKFQTSPTAFRSEITELQLLQTLLLHLYPLLNTVLMVSRGNMLKLCC